MKTKPGKMSKIRISRNKSTWIFFQWDLHEKWDLPSQSKALLTYSIFGSPVYINKSIIITLSSLFLKRLIVCIGKFEAEKHEIHVRSFPVLEVLF